MKKAPNEDTIDKTAITARITQLEHEIPQDQARVESEMTRLAMKRGALLELRQLLAVKAPENTQEIAKNKAPARARGKR